jgi:GWxTD domain-containing protein
MLMGWLVGAVLAAVQARSTTGGAQNAPGLEIAAARFYRAPTKQTVVDVFCRVPLAIVTARGAPAEQAVFQVAVSVSDSTGLEILPSQTWIETVPARMLVSRGASTVEHFRFAAKPGRYTLEVTVTDSGSGRVSRRRAEVEAYAASPGVSDLLLAAGARASAGGADTTPRPGEVRKGTLFLEASGWPVLTPRRASLAYYVELYAEEPETATVTLRVKRPDGGQIVETPPARVALGAGGGASQGTVDLGGLPPGDYRLEAEMRTGGRRVLRAAVFGMAGFSTEAALDVAPPGEPSDAFATLDEARLDTLYGPLVYLMTGEEQGIYSGLSLEGKRAYLRRFWVVRDPTPGTVENEAQVTFYAGVAEANRRFREGGAAAIPGWRTDRGRVYLRYGAPDEVLNRRQAGSTSPYEVWKYTRGRARKYVFFDQTRFGNYVLIWTDDRREPSRPNWRELLGPEAITDVERF